MDRVSRPSVLRVTDRGSVFELDLSALTVVDTIGLQRLVGNLPWGQILARFDQGCAEAIQLLYFAARRAAGDQIEFDSAANNFRWGQVDFEWRDAPTPPTRPAAAEPVGQDGAPPA